MQVSARLFRDGHKVSGGCWAFPKRFPVPTRKSLSVHLQQVQTLLRGTAYPAGASSSVLVLSPSHGDAGALHPSLCSPVPRTSSRGREMLAFSMAILCFLCSNWRIYLKKKRSNNKCNKRRLFFFSQMARAFISRRVLFMFGSPDVKQTHGVRRYRFSIFHITAPAEGQNLVSLTLYGGKAFLFTPFLRT